MERGQERRKEQRKEQRNEEKKGKIIDVREGVWMDGGIKEGRREGRSKE